VYHTTYDWLDCPWFCCFLPNRMRSRLYYFGAKGLGGSLSEPKILIWDLEFRATENYAHQLRIYPGYIICFSCKEYGKPKIKTYSALTHPGKNITDDRKLVKVIGEELYGVDLHIFHYGARCDAKFIRTKLQEYKLPLIPTPLNYVDTCEIAQRELALKSNSLAALAQFLKLEEQKMPVTEIEWQLAFTGHATTLKKVEKRCASDVRLTELVYEEMLPLCSKHPAITKLRQDGLVKKFPKNCPRCGVSAIQSNGVRLTASGRYLRWRCRNLSCGITGSVIISDK